jgi:hypothetical protein
MVGTSSFVLMRFSPDLREGKSLLACDGGPLEQTA